MSSAVSHPAPTRNRAGFYALLFGAAAAPIFWLGQMMLGYWVSALACYGGNHPTTIASGTALRSTLIVFGIVALLAVLAGAIVSWRSWRLSRDEKKGGPNVAIHVGEGRVRFLAIWGLMSSLWFFGAILFNTIATIVAPLCTR
ncbi:MAG: hypothetical protein WBQ17_02915 [Rhizomicrobium sp.]|jgi:hypothetical protein